jgi:tagaturonate reductase
MRNERIIQFGEGNFLRGFVDDFIQKMNDAGNFSGSVVVIQPLENGWIETLNQQEGKYNLFLRGLDDGKVTEDHRVIDVISRGINPYSDYQAYMNLAAQKNLRFIISNTTESGIQVNPLDSFTDQPASSFPGKLTQLLFKRFTLNLPGFIILPCELIDNNGQELKKAILSYADIWKLSDEFKKWIQDDNEFFNTLVDRIVTGYPKEEVALFSKRLGYEDKLLNTAELFHLWVIEGNAENEFPLEKSGVNVIWTNDVKPYKERKVRILNGAHTCLVPLAMLKGHHEVKESIEDKAIETFLYGLIFEEIIPTLTLPKEEMQDFAYAVLERFKNPYIHHQLKSIALNEFDKFKVRVIPSIIQYKKLFGKEPVYLMKAFDAFYEFYQTDLVNDAQDKIDFMRSHTKEEVFKKLCE